MAAPDAIRRLVEQFDEHREVYHSPGYNETQVRRDFIDPFFATLGWDVDNRKGYSEAYREVIHEDAIKIGGSTKAPDYCFRVGAGVRTFFVEAKRPSVDLRADVAPAFQLRRYAWSAKLPISILTDFEEFALYDCRIRPAKTDKASTGRVMYIRYTDYLDKWDELFGLLSPEAIRRGAIDKFLGTKKLARGTAEVDREFLAEIESWRDVLARNIALRNPDISQRDLNFAVQRTIDRIVFLRICEDRGIEPYGTLRALENGPTVYPRLGELFRRADERYNSGLFHFTHEKDRREPPDEMTLGLTIDDKVLKDLLHNLYYPESPYEFSVLPAEILGQVYEQFLGKVIRLTKGHQAKVEEKPEVKKAGGVYYTPAYIVEYIVRHTIGKLVEGRTPQEIGGLTKTWKPAKSARPLTVVDPACGSGSFLLGAYQFLLDWHRDWYETDGPEKHAAGSAPRLYRAPSGEWRLTTAERKRILLAHIFGVDIDSQAVEVTKLSLLLKVLEGESGETIELQRRLFHERALPDLSRNIKCGNSLIAPDFYDNRQQDLFDEEEALRINAFEWKDEFPEIFRGSNPGFDVVIGNPPYVRMEIFKNIKDYLRDNYEWHAERTDLYVYFLEREHALLRDGGRLGIIVSNKFIKAKYGQPLRKQLKLAANIERIVDLAGLPVFRGATVRTVILVTEKSLAAQAGFSLLYSPPPQKPAFTAVDTGTQSLDSVVDPIAYPVSSDELCESGWRLMKPECGDLMDKLRGRGRPLKEVTDGRICMGIKSGLTAAFVIDAETRNRIIKANPEAKRIIHPFLQGRQIQKWKTPTTSEYLVYTHHGIDMAPYPAVIEHLGQFRRRLEGRVTKQQWYELQQPQFAYYEYLRRPKIVFPDIATGCRFTLDRSGCFVANTVYFLPTAELSILGLLNSRIGYFFFQQTCAALEGPGEAYLRFFGQYLENFPIPSPGQLTRRDLKRMVSLVETMLKLHEESAKAKEPHRRTVIERRIAATDRQIDQLVYELYGLSDEEITIVEQATEAKQ